MELIETARIALQKAEREKKKAATFHCLVLLHAEELVEYGGKDFCRDVGAKETYKTEFAKMIAVARRLREMGYAITKIK